MLKMAASFVLGRVSRCGVAQGYASLAPLPAALLDGHFEHPVMLASTTNAGTSQSAGPLSIVGSIERLSDVNGRSFMKYLLLVHHDEEAFGKISETQRKEILAESLQLTHQLHANEQYVHASPLHPAATGVIVRVREGKQVVTDGPFIETREQIAGYFLINAKDLNEAISIATRVPGARIGTVEVRPLIEITGLPNT
jgi:hypothetical protein